MKCPRRTSGSIRVWAARGGHGATTIAGALGVLLGTHARSHDQDALDWMWTNDRPIRPNQGTTIHDEGVLTGPLATSPSDIVVLRGPCSVALRELAYRSVRIDHLILIREPWRPLRPSDVEDALGKGIDAEVEFSFRVARLADAGLLSARVVGLPEFADLRSWTDRQLVASLPTP